VILQQELFVDLIERRACFAACRLEVQRIKDSRTFAASKAFGAATASEVCWQFQATHQPAMTPCYQPALGAHDEGTACWAALQSELVLAASSLALPACAACIGTDGAVSARQVGGASLGTSSVLAPAAGTSCGEVTYSVLETLGGEVTNSVHAVVHKN